MISDPPLDDVRPSVSSGKDRSDGADGHGRRKPWTPPHLRTVDADDYGTGAGDPTTDGPGNYQP